MKLNLTDGKSLFSFYISREVDPKEWDAVAQSKRPVSKALDIIKERIGAEVFAGLYPVAAPMVALEGLPS